MSKKRIRRRKKRRLKKSVKIFFILLILIILIIIGLKFIYPSINKETKTLDNKSQTPIIKEHKEIKKDIHQELSLIAVGDYLIHSSVYKDANSHANYNGYDFKPMISNIKEIVKDYDLAYYNQETILGGTELGLADYPTFNSPYEAGDAMIDAGFNLVSLATNHTMDSGAKAVENSCKYWKKQQNILTAGSYCSDEEREEIRIQEKNGIKYTMLNYSYGTNGMPRIKDYYINLWPTDIDNINNPETDTKYQAYKEQVKKDIEKVRDKVDLLIVAMHWGVEYTHTPTAYQQDMAKFLADNKVNLIIGTHPHVIQPVAWIGDTLVIYSLGNFISAQYQNKAPCQNYACTVELMTNLKVEKDNNKIKITNVENELIYNYYNQSSWRGFNVIPFSNEKIKEYLPNYKTIYETYKNVIQKMDANMIVKSYQQ